MYIPVFNFFGPYTNIVIMSVISGITDLDLVKLAKQS